MRRVILDTRTAEGRKMSLGEGSDWDGMENEMCNAGKNTTICHREASCFRVLCSYDIVALSLKIGMSRFLHTRFHAQ